MSKTRHMTSVGIMSMQRIYNYGSSLQAYGLRRLIEHHVEGAQVSFVDYVPGEPLIKDAASSEPTSRLRRSLAKVAEYNQVDASLRDRLRFFNHKRTYGKKYFPLMGIPTEPARDLALDVQVIGSDEVFNCVQSNTNVGYSRDLFGHGSPARRLVSYAASFGNTTLDKLTEFGVRDEVAADLSRFDALSVRDQNSADLVKTLTGRTPTINVDPALAYDFMAQEARIPTGRPRPEPYLLVYGYSGRLGKEENDALRSYARARGARILCAGGVQDCCDEFIDCNPFELLAYFRHAEGVVTDTFHGTIFSLINERPFATIVRRSSGLGYGNEEKLGYLLDTFGLQTRRVDDTARLVSTLDEPLDYGPVATVLAHERARTADYLSSAIAQKVADR